MSRRRKLRNRARRGGRTARDSVNRAVAGLASATGLGHYVVLDYPATSSPRPRVRRDGRLHDLVAAGERDYRRALRVIGVYGADLARIPRVAGGEREPAWINEFLPGLDSAAIYAFVRSREPRTYLEVGSGNSTRFARRAIEDGGLPTRIVSIDPGARPQIDGLCDEVVRQPLELVDPRRLDALGAGDVLFLDGSHRAFTGSDATVFCLDLLPRLAPGLLVGIHDVYLPDDYPEEIAARHYSEQYLLGALLLGEPSWLRPVLAADYVSKRADLARELGDLWSRPGLEGIETHGVAFWFELAGS